MKRRVKYISASQEEIHKGYILAKRVRREFHKLLRDLLYIRDSLGRMHKMLEETNRDPDGLWAKFKRDLLEAKVEDYKLPSTFQ